MSSIVWVSGTECASLYGDSLRFLFCWQQAGRTLRMHQLCHEAQNFQRVRALGQAPLEGGWGSLLKRRYRRIMILASALPILQQASGINSVVFYSSDVRTHTLFSLEHK